MTMRRCRICGAPATDRHHVFGGPNRPNSERYGLVVWLCRRCHGEIHFGEHGREMAEKLRKEFQLKFQKDNPGVRFEDVFHRNYLDPEDAKSQGDEGFTVAADITEGL